MKLSPAVRSRMSPLWGAFRNGMSSLELAYATSGAVSRATAARFLESAADRGELERQKEAGRGRGVVRYWRTGEAPAPASVAMVAMRPLRSAFAGRPIIPVREGGRVAPVVLDRQFEAVGRGA